MENLDFVKLATSSDKSRYNLTGVYRDTDKYVATDGHRMHISNGLPEAEPHYTDDTSTRFPGAQFPDYKQVIPDSPIIASTLVFASYAGYKELKPFMGRFKKLVTLLKAYAKQPIVELSVTKGKAHIIARTRSGFECTLLLPCEVRGEETLKPIGINVIYFFDALRIIESEALEIRIQSDPLSIIEFKGAESKSAWVMPCRLT